MNIEKQNTINEKYNIFSKGDLRKLRKKANDNNFIRFYLEQMERLETLNSKDLKQIVIKNLKDGLKLW